MESGPTPSTVRVCVRCRPLSLKEGRGKKCVALVRDRITVGDKVFTFDGVYGESSTQEEVFNGSIAGLVEGCFQGFNATVLAYGQTGSGKTHTMIGNALTGESDEEGVIPRAVRYIFYILAEKMRSTESKFVPSLHVSFIEIYNDEVKDLLHPDILSRDIFIREDKLGKIFFTGAREEVVLHAENALEYLDKGNMARTTAETLMNASSSRSHAIFTLSIELYEYNGTAAAVGPTGESQVGGQLITSKIHLVDLAGSERVKKTGAGGVRLKESVGINQVWQYTVIPIYSCNFETD
jgi:Kinesin motor domain